MRNSLFIIPLVLLFGCSAPRPTTVVHTEYVTVRDSVYFRDTTVEYKIEKEYVKDYTGLLDTLVLSTGYADARAWVDTSRAVLTGEIKNKEKALDIPIQVKEHIVYRDSLAYQEIPVPVEVVKTKYPAAFWWLWAYMVLTLALMGFKIWLKFHP